jgi:hypothetical protein
MLFRKNHASPVHTKRRGITRMDAIEAHREFAAFADAGRRSPQGTSGES